MTRVHIGLPMMEQCSSDFTACLAAMCLTTVYDRKLRREIAVSVSSQVGSNYVLARNEMVAHARRFSATHLFFLDSDMTFPVDTLSRLFSHHVDCVGADYVKRRDESGTTMGVPLPNAAPRGPLKPMFHLPLGVMLIKMSVFDALPTPYFDYRQSGAVSEDTAFCAAIRENGHTVWCDTDLTLQVGHAGTKIYRPAGSKLT